LKYLDISQASGSHNLLEIMYMLIGMDAEHNGKYNRDGGGWFIQRMKLRTERKHGTHLLKGILPLHY